LVVLVAAVAGLTAGVARANPGIFVDTSPGTNSPPATLGPYTMTAFGADPQPEFADVSGVAAPGGGTVGFSPSLEHRIVPDSWATWSNGYTGDVYWNGAQGNTMLSMPTGTAAFYFYVEPDAFATLNVTATAQDGTTTTVPVSGDSGAQYFGFYGTGGDTISSITVSSDDGDFAVGEFGIVTDADLSLAQPSDVTVNATSPLGAVVHYSNPAATDEDLSTVTVSCLPASGSTFAIGDTKVTCTATDTDGDANSPVTKTFTVHVRGAAEQLADLAKAVKGVGPGTSLADKVAAAQAYLAAGDKTDACGTLNAFINEVRAQSGKSIPPSTASSLIASARQVEAVIGC
jgi:hypothetical protein